MRDPIDRSNPHADTGVKIFRSRLFLLILFIVLVNLDTNLIYTFEDLHLKNIDPSFEFKFDFSVAGISLCVCIAYSCSVTDELFI